MPQYVAFLRGVTPTNAKMADLRRCFEATGFTEVRTLLSSGNVLFSTRTASVDVLERRAETAIQKELKRSFATIVRSTQSLQELLDSDPFGAFEVPPTAKRVVTFLRRPLLSPPSLPVEWEGATILKQSAQEVFTTYVPHPKGPMFMTLLERTFGKDITTRTLETVRKCAHA